MTSQRIIPIAIPQYFRQLNAFMATEYGTPGQLVEQDPRMTKKDHQIVQDDKPITHPPLSTLERPGSLHLEKFV